MKKQTRMNADYADKDTPPLLPRRQLSQMSSETALSPETPPTPPSLCRFRCDFVLSDTTLA
jgi:hypothetical protein